MTATTPLRIPSTVHDLGGFSVRRLLPYRLRRAIGPFVFFDHIGPAEFPAGQGIDVRPHPHIGLATVTYLFEGALMHRDSLGSAQAIRPGDVNWMTAGRGIAHSERTPSPERAAGHRLHGLQIWVALPDAQEEAPPSFHHHPSASLPAWSDGGVRLRLILGEAFGRRSPVATFSATFYLAADFDAGAILVLPDALGERGVYVVEGEVLVDDETLGVGDMLALPPGADATLRSALGARVVLFGGAPLGERHMWWNFVSSSRERIDRAKADWLAQRFGQVPGETEFIPLPER